MLDSIEQLYFNLKNETVLEAIIEKQVVGYVIFQHKLGRITQLAVKKTYRQKGIGTRLISEIQNLSDVKPLAVINVEENEQTILYFLKKLGFKNQINQWEMELNITKK